MSRAGSQDMKRGRRGARVEALVVEEEVGEDDMGRKREDEMEVLARALTRSIIFANLSSSSGQMSGQCVNPK